MTHPSNIDVRDAANSSQSIAPPAPFGRAAAADSKPVAISTEDQAVQAAISSAVVAANTATGAQADAAWSGTGSGSLIAILKAIYSKVAAALGVKLQDGGGTNLTSTLIGSKQALDVNVPRAVTFTNSTEGSDSPYTLTSSWTKVATMTTADRGLVISPIASAVTFDIEWTSVTAGSGTPADVYGVPIFGGENFQNGIPIGDIYLKSATGQVAVVKTGA